MAASRKDNKGRVLRKGETQRSRDLMYVYTYTGADGKRHSIYNKDIVKLREREKLLIKAQLDGFNLSGVHTLDMLFDRYIAFKANPMSFSSSVFAEVKLFSPDTYATLLLSYAYTSILSYSVITFRAYPL